MSQSTALDTRFSEECEKVTAFFLEKSEGMMSGLIAQVTKHSKLPLYYIAFYELLQLAILDYGPRTTYVNKVLSMLKTLRFPEIQEGGPLRTYETESIRKFLLAGYSILTLSWIVDSLDGSPTAISLFEQMDNGKIEGRDKFQLGKDLIAAHELLISVRSRVLKEGWQVGKQKAAEGQNDEEQAERVALIHQYMLSGGGTPGKRPLELEHARVDDRDASEDPDTTEDDEGS